MLPSTGQPNIAAFHSPRVYCPFAEEEVFGRVTRSVPEQCGDSRGNKFPYESAWPSAFAWEYSGLSGEEYVAALWATTGVVNTAIVLANAEGSVAAADCSLLRQHGGSLVLIKAWAKSLLNIMGFVKRKGSTSVKVPVPEFEKRKEQYLWTFMLKL